MATKKNNKKTKEDTASNRPPDDVSVAQAMQSVMDSLMDLGNSLVSLPLLLLSEESRQHFEAAGSEFGRGVSVVLHDVASRLERTADKPQSDNKG